jgi:hypothetical protein
VSNQDNCPIISPVMMQIIIRVNLERVRWVLHEDLDTLIKIRISVKIGMMFFDQAQPWRRKKILLPKDNSFSLLL